MRISDWSSDVCSSDLSGRQKYRTLPPCVYFVPPVLLLPSSLPRRPLRKTAWRRAATMMCIPAGRSSSPRPMSAASRSEEHTSELQSLMRISYADFCLKKKNKKTLHDHAQNDTYFNITSEAN